MDSLKGGYSHTMKIPYKNKIKRYLENHRGLKREGGVTSSGFHSAIIFFVCVMNVKSEDEHNNKEKKV